MLQHKNIHDHCNPETGSNDGQCDSVANVHCPYSQLVDVMPLHHVLGTSRNKGGLRVVGAKSHDMTRKGLMKRDIDTMLAYLALIGLMFLLPLYAVHSLV